MLSGMVDIWPIWRSLGVEKTQTLPIFHDAFTGTDNVGKFSETGKTNWFQQNIKAGMELTTAIMKLLKFVGSMYCPKRVNITNI